MHIYIYVTRELGTVFQDAYATPHVDVIKWKHFPRYWPFVRGIHGSPVKSPHKGQWRGALMFSLICALNKHLSKQSWGWWFEMPSRSLWCHYNVTRELGTVFQDAYATPGQDDNQNWKYTNKNVFDTVVHKELSILFGLKDIELKMRSLFVRSIYRSNHKISEFHDFVYCDADSIDPIPGLIY